MVEVRGREREREREKPYHKRGLNREEKAINRYKEERCWKRMKVTLISLETAVWCSALHTTKNMKTGLGVTKL